MCGNFNWIIYRSRLIYSSNRYSRNKDGYISVNANLVGCAKLDIILELAESHRIDFETWARILGRMNREGSTKGSIYMGKYSTRLYICIYIYIYRRVLLCIQPAFQSCPLISTSRLVESQLPDRSNRHVVRRSRIRSRLQPTYSLLISLRSLR